MSTDFLDAAGQTYHDFLLTKVIEIKELQCTLRELTHIPSGAQVIHIDNDDPENLFCISFKTLPYNSNGVAHILEHTVLCGSRKFPVKDPFFAMTRRSLNTFMNALTGSDFTCYPAATQVEKDFYNLFDVYIDAVFHPLLKEASFLQEGHRLEFSDSQNPSSPLENKGIVFNEMKGSLSSADARLWHAMMEHLCPNLPYAYNSGGDPKVIPQLTYQELLSFHEAYYHPSRALFFFYGNLPLKKHLDFISEKILKNTPKQPPLPPIPLQKRFTQGVYKELSYPSHETEDTSAKTLIAFGYLTTPLIDQKEVLALSVLDSILMDTDASLLKMPLLQSGLCIHADAYMDTEMSEVPWIFVFKGCQKEHAEKLQVVFKQSIEKIIQKGIPAHLIESAIHQLEFTRTEISGESAPFGLTIFMRSALAKQHGCPPENSLTIHAHFEELRKAVKDPHYLTNLLKKYLLDNPHFVRIVMNPDPTLSSKELSEEKSKLQELRNSLNQEAIQKLLIQAELLAKYQKETETQSIDCLPKVNLDDVPLFSHQFALHEEKIGKLHVYHHACFTNQILYADLVFDLPQISASDLPYVQLLLTLLPEIGAGKRDYAANLEYIHAHTGGVGASASLHIQVTDPEVTSPTVSIRGKSLYRKASHLFALLADMATSPSFSDKKRIKELIQQTNTSLQNRLSRQALRYAIQLSLSGFSSPSYIADQWYGWGYYKMIQSLSQNLDKELPKLIEKLIYLKDTLLGLGNPHLVLSCDASMYKQLVKEQFYGLCNLPFKSFNPWDGHYPLTPTPRQARTIASPVAFIADSYKTIHYLHPHAPALSAATHLFENKILHKKIREQGGAYGSGASYSPLQGHFHFHSYRDPHIAKTLHTFQEAIASIAEGAFDARDLEEAKLGMIQQWDTPVAPGHRAALAYAWERENKTHARRQAFREHFLALSPKDITKAVEQELLTKKEEGVVVCFAGKELIEKENILLAKEGKPLKILPI